MSGHKPFDTIRPNDDFYVKALYYAFGRNDTLTSSFSSNPYVINLLHVDSVAFAHSYAEHRENGGSKTVQDWFSLFQAEKINSAG